jgi:hypothetical protein
VYLEVDKVMSRLHFLKVVFLCLFVLAACRREEPVPSPVSPTATPPAVSQPAITPAEPEPSLIGSLDGLPRPKVIGRSPTAGQELAADGAIEIYFDQPMDIDRTTEAWRVFDAEGQEVAGEITFPQPRILHFKPDRPFQTNTLYQAEIGASAASMAGESLLEGLNLTFNTLSDLAVSQTSPPEGTRDVAVDTTITVIFNRPVVPLLIAEEQANLPNPLTLTPAVDGQGEWVNTSVYLFRPSTALPGNQDFTVQVQSDVINEVSASGAMLAGDVS